MSDLTECSEYRYQKAKLRKLAHLYFWEHQPAESGYCDINQL